MTEASVPADAGAAASADDAAAPQSATPLWLAVTIAVLFGVLYAYDVWEAVGNLVGLNVQAKGMRDVNLYFDKATGLLTKMESSIQTADGTHASQEVVFLNYRDTVGPKHWMRIAVFTQHQKTFEAEVAEVRFHDKIRDDYFARPVTKEDKNRANAKPGG